MKTSHTAGRHLPAGLAASQSDAVNTPKVRMNASRALNRREEEARNIIRAEMERRGVNYKELARRLEELGVDETPKNLGMKINRGTFSFALALMVFRALGNTRPDLAELPKPVPRG